MSNPRLTKVGLVQIGDCFGKQYYLPYSVAILQAYALKNLKNAADFEFSLPLYKRLRIKEAAEKLSDKDIIFFSVYIWNYNISLEIAKVVKRKNNDCIIVFGGPQVPERQDAAAKFMDEYPFIDIACYSEGEVPFLGILNNFSTKSWDSIPSIVFRSLNGAVKYQEKCAEIKKLELIPSPYLTEVFDALINEFPDEQWSALFETNRGCPFTCAFCYWGDRQRKIYLFHLKRVFQEIDWFTRRKIEFVFCCDANFGMLTRDKRIVMKIASNKERFGFPKAFSVQNTKNSSDRIFTIQKILNDAGLQKGVNLALQSVNDTTLANVYRCNINNDVYQKLQAMFSKEKIHTFTDLIIGLPGETYDTFSSGVSKLIESGQHNRIQFISLIVLANTSMADKEYQKEHGLILKKTRLIPHHTLLAEEEVSEYQDMVIGTKTMPPNEWLKAKVFSWMASLLYFDKLLQVPFSVIGSEFSVFSRELIELFMSVPGHYSTLNMINSFFLEKAKGLQSGESEYCGSKEWLNIHWPADEFIFIKICSEGNLARFYSEAEELLAHFLGEKGITGFDELLKEAILLNKALIRLPFKDKDEEIRLDFNICEVYSSILEGKKARLEKKYSTYRIMSSENTYPDWESWCREVVWYGSKRGAYLYSCSPVSNKTKLLEVAP